MSEESPLAFPCDFPIKIMGRDTPKFHAIARSLVEKHTGPIDDGAIKTNSSRNGRFISITVTVHAKNKAQLDNIYRDVSGHDEVLLAL